MSPPPIRFWFDFITPYGHLASLRIDDLAAHHELIDEWLGRGGW